MSPTDLLLQHFRPNRFDAAIATVDPVAWCSSQSVCLCCGKNGSTDRDPVWGGLFGTQDTLCQMEVQSFGSSTASERSSGRRILPIIEYENIARKLLWPLVSFTFIWYLWTFNFGNRHGHADIRQSSTGARTCAVSAGWSCAGKRSAKHQLSERRKTTQDDIGFVRPSDYIAH